MRSAASLPLADGLRLERDLFLRLRSTPQAAALRHAFLGEREVSKIPDIPPDVQPRDIAQVAVVGAGTMGTGIAMCFADAGIPVRLLEAQPANLERGMDAVRRNYASAVARGALTQAEMDRRLSRVRPTLDYADLADADLVVEAVFEELGVKEQVFRRLDEVASPGTTHGSYTS